MPRDPWEAIGVSARGCGSGHSDPVDSVVSVISAPKVLPVKSWALNDLPDLQSLDSVRCIAALNT